MIVKEHAANFDDPRLKLSLRCQCSFHRGYELQGGSLSFSD